MNDITSYKKGICPYCKTGVGDDALVCKNCGRETFLIFRFIDFISDCEANLKKFQAQQKEQKVDIRFILAYLVSNILLGYLLLGQSGGSGVYQFQIFLWMSSLIYGYVSIKYFFVRNVWVLAFFPVIIPVILETLLKNVSALVPETWPYFTGERWTTIFLSAGFSLTVALFYYWPRRKQFEIDEFFSLTFFLGWFSKYTGRVELVQKFILDLITLGSIIVYIVTFGEEVTI